MVFRSYFYLSLFFTVMVFTNACRTSKLIKDGSTAFKQKQYSVAVDFLLQEVSGRNSGEEYAIKAFMLGESYKYLSDTDNALKWYIESAKNDYGVDAYWEMAYMLKKKERYDDAILSFQRLRSMTRREDLIAQEIEKCRQAIAMKRASLNEDIIISPHNLNSEALDYSSTLYQGKYIVFTSDRPQSTGRLTYYWTGNSFSDLYMAELDGSNVRPFDESLNTIHNEGTACFNKDGTEIFFTFCHAEIGDSHCRIVRSKKTENGWSTPRDAFRMKPGVNYGDPALIEDDKVLIFVSNDLTGVGGHDLYYSVREDDDTWSDPDLMPTYLNTSGNERFPTWHDGTLYYSSDHLAGLGGLDIFSTTLNEDGSWTRPVNLLPPFNSSEDDYGIIFLPDSLLPNTVKRAGFFTSTRGVYKGDDIYSFTEFFPEGETRIHVEEIDTTETVVLQEEPKKYFLLLKVQEKLFANPANPNSFVVGSGGVEAASIVFRGDERSDIKQTDRQGLFLMPLFNYPYQVTGIVGKQGYLSNRVDIKIDTIGKNYPDGYVFEYEVILDKIYEGLEIVIDDIYYEFDKADIKEEAKPALIRLAEILNNNPTIKIELSAHTDCRGEEDYNMRLSEARAASAAEYLVKLNPSLASRMTSRGYGESQPEIDCVCEKCSEDEHQINRRTTFTIIK